MFRWYRDSLICYVHLVDHTTDATLDLTDLFFQCKWFTRGWTLQELIAPADVTFFSNDWRFLGTKHTLCREISQRTKIPIEVLLLEKHHHEYSVAMRMSWAADRKTTRVEDIAYCLFGIFDINMPLLYGEGKKAFRRLQEEISRTMNDPTIFAWLPKPIGFSSEYSTWPGGFLAPDPSYFGHFIEHMRKKGYDPRHLMPAIHFSLQSHSALPGATRLTSKDVVFSSQGIEVDWPVIAAHGQDLIVLPCGIANDVPDTDLETSPPIVQALALGVLTAADGRLARRCTSGMDAMLWLSADFPRDGTEKIRTLFTVDPQSSLDRTKRDWTLIDIVPTSKAEISVNSERPNRFRIWSTEDAPPTGHCSVEFIVNRLDAHVWAKVQRRQGSYVCNWLEQCLVKDELWYSGGSVNPAISKGARLEIPVIDDLGQQYRLTLAMKERQTELRKSHILDRWITLEVSALWAREFWDGSREAIPIHDVPMLGNLRLLRLAPEIPETLGPDQASQPSTGISESWFGPPVLRARRVSQGPDTPQDFDNPKPWVSERLRRVERWLDGDLPWALI